MDYEKKYKEALERARVWKEKSGMPTDRQGILDDIFPELKESEDERIRKDIIQFVQSRLAGFPECERFVAWLEKQGTTAEKDRGGYNLGFACGKQRVLKNPEDFGLCKKPEWSEEDEKKRTLLISILEVNHPNEYFKVNPANTSNMEAMHTEELVSWLKSLKDMVQPKQEWSEEDEIRLKHILRLLDVKDDKKYLLMFGLNSLQDLKKDIAWLKSLRPQTTWKPVKGS